MRGFPLLVVAAVELEGAAASFKLRGCPLGLLGSVGGSFFMGISTSMLGLLFLGWGSAMMS